MLTFQSETLPIPIEQRLGIVMSVELERGSLTLLHRNGVCSHLTADPSLLVGLRSGGPVLAQVEGAIVRTLRRL
jgi:hypothetical protein